MERKKSLSSNTHSKSSKSNNTEELILSEKIRIGIIAILHLVGLIGFSIPAYKPLFQFITPYHLLIISIVLVSEKKLINKGFILFFAISFFIGYGAEVIGVKSGLLFGYYEYTNILGLKLLDVPLCLGLLWATTAYAANEIANKVIQNIALKIVIASLLMVLFDFLLEPFAIQSNLWQWKSASIPNYNYVSWFMVGLVLSTIFQNTVKILPNKVSPYFFFIQILFFIAFRMINGSLSFGLFD